MNLAKMTSVVLMLGFLAAFLLILPVIINATTAAAADAATIGDSATEQTLNIMPLIASVAGIGVVFMFVMAIVNR
tara:strand:- start:405 stop:629 length:225 start_codon:yes stop_codon:yes gene_type:complete